MSKFALVSTVDYDGFPNYEVIVFSTDTQAIEYAVMVIVANDSDVEYSDGEWIMGEECFRSPEELLEAWQSTLTATEFFHVFPIVKPRKKKKGNRDEV